MIDLKGKKVLLTGGYGFLGEPLYNKLVSRGSNIFRFHRTDYNLTKEADVVKLFDDIKPEIVVHIAADVGGIGYNKEYPGQILFNNLMMNTLIQEYARLYLIIKFVGIGSVCAYPKYTLIPFHEEDLWKGYPEETNAAYGLSKRMMLVQSQQYRYQYSFNAIHLIMMNLYGPRDNFDLETSHVIPAMIRKFIEARRMGKREVVLWGNGSPTREFLYVGDAAEGIVLATERYDKPDPVNLGAGFEIKIKDLAESIKKMVGYKGKIVWDTTKPNGQPRRCLDVTKAEKEFGFRAKMNFEEGLRRTIEWYGGNK